MKVYLQVDPEHGVPSYPKRELFLPEQKEKAEQILKVVEGMRICTALCLLDKCKAALIQSTVDVD